MNRLGHNFEDIWNKMAALGSGERGFTPPPTLIFEGQVDDKLYSPFKIYYFVIDAVFCLPTTFGNILVLVALWRFSGLRKSRSCILIGNLAISDLLVGAVVFPVHMLLLMDGELSKCVAFCLLHHCLIFTLVGTTVLNLFLLSLERFYAITKPFSHSETFTKRRLYLAIALIWICMFAYGFLPVFGWHEEVTENYFTCGVTPLLSELYSRIICCVIALSLIVNGIFFFIIANIAIKAASDVNDVNLSDDHHERTRKGIHHTKMMIMISGLFIVFWAPFCVMTLIPKPTTIIKLITAWCASLGFINSCVNWIVYAIRSAKFRVAFKAILTCNCEEASHEISNLT